MIKKFKVKEIVFVIIIMVTLFDIYSCTPSVNMTKDR